MKTTVLKSMLLVGLMSVSTVMMGSTKTDKHHEVMNNGHRIEMHDQHCQHEMRHGRCLDIHCQCHKHQGDMKHGDKRMGGPQKHQHGERQMQQDGYRQSQQNEGNHSQTNGCR